MLQFFQVKSFYCGAQIALYVDLERGDAVATYTWQKRIVRPFEPVPFHEVRTPEMAETWLRGETRETGNRIESFHWRMTRQPRARAA
jgi:hypothetical protein